MPPLTILHEDAHILVVHKPSGLLAQPDPSGAPDVLSRAKEREGGTDPFVGLVHRLDRPTSGLMVLARASEAARALSRQFRERTVHKEYLAVVEGTLRGAGTWRDYIAKPGRRPAVVGPDHPEGKPAALDWQALRRADGRTLLRVQLRTGRPHQVRLQAAERGGPVAGDARYGAAGPGPEAGIALHHAILRIEHPADARMETYVAPPPAGWAPLLTAEMNDVVDRILTRARPAR
jgi:tRNA pseudouridine32 synthase/23S rRNA pseudouridine746 synthase/23S rRNA pseudouridine1911/1915/1917 synthase